MHIDQPVVRRDTKLQNEPKQVLSNDGTRLGASSENMRQDAGTRFAINQLRKRSTARKIRKDAPHYRSALFRHPGSWLGHGGWIHEVNYRNRTGEI